MTEAEVYWATRLGRIHVCLEPICICLAIFFIMIAIVHSVTLITDDVDFKNGRRVFKRALSIVGLCLLFSIAASIFTPTTKEYAAIKFVPKLINSKIIQEDLPKETRELYKQFKTYITQQMKEKE